MDQTLKYCEDSEVTFFNVIAIRGPQIAFFIVNPDWHRAVQFEVKSLDGVLGVYPSQTGLIILPQFNNVYTQAMVYDVYKDWHIVHYMLQQYRLQTSAPEVNKPYSIKDGENNLFFKDFYEN